MSKIDELVKGYGPKFPGVETILSAEPTKPEILRLRMPIPGLGRYAENTKFLEEITSSEAVGLLRFRVAKAYFHALCNTMSCYQHGGKFGNKTVCGEVKVDDMVAIIEQIGVTVDDVYRAELMEKFTEHDTAAATDYLKLAVGTRFPKLEPMLDGFHFGLTSEDNIGLVFGIVLNKLVYKHFIPELIGLCEFLMDYAWKLEKDQPLVLPWFTHEQGAEVTTLGKIFMNRLSAIEDLLENLIDRENPNHFRPFSGKSSSAIGNFTTLYAAYPDIDWRNFAKLFVESLGLTNVEMADQCVPYTIEVSHFATIANILTQVIKLADDFVKMVRAPAQFFVKIKKAGTKGSSVMPNKSNMWNIEGAIRMLREAQDRLFFYCKELPQYPEAGNMGRSYLMRNIGDVFMPIFPALARIKKEIGGCAPNPEKIKAFFHEYPGIAGSIIQTVLKRENVAGDAYRMIEKIAINPGGTYANAEQFKSGLDEMCANLKLSEELKQELLAYLNPENGIGKAAELAEEKMAEMLMKFQKYKEMARGIYAPG
ncbi:MAG: lyase family protein [Candidatus Doudnabacteria bacterium]|nr:lyase family protein [bacterium]MDZ4244176.1 lyase family protein [Candidatus Doudnabacteria bacterium]